MRTRYGTKNIFVDMDGDEMKELGKMLFWALFFLAAACVLCALCPAP